MEKCILINGQRFWFGANQLRIRGLLAEVTNRDGGDGGHLSIRVISFDFSPLRTHYQTSCHEL